MGDSRRVWGWWQINYPFWGCAVTQFGYYVPITEARRTPADLPHTRSVKLKGDGKMQTTDTELFGHQIIAKKAIRLAKRANPHLDTTPFLSVDERKELHS